MADYDDIFGVDTSEEPQPGKYDDIFGVSTQPVKERGILGDIASNIARGAVDTAELAGHALSTVGLETPGEFIVEKSEKAQKDIGFLQPDKSEAEGEGFVERGVKSGIRSAVPSLTAGLGGAAVGGAIGSVVPGVGTVVGGLIGGTLGALGLYGPGVYGKEKKRAIEEGLSEEEAHAHGLEQALIEGGIEAVATPLQLMTLGFGKAVTQPIKQTIKELIKTPAKQLLKNYAKNAGVEVSTEMIQSGLGAEFAAKHGLDESTTSEAVLESIIPAITMSLIFGTGAHAFNAKKKRELRNALSDGEASPESRQEAANTIWNSINKEDPELAESWRIQAQDAIINNQPIDIDESFSEFAAKRQAEEVVEPDVDLSPGQQTVLDSLSEKPVKPKSGTQKAHMNRLVKLGIAQETEGGYIRAEEFRERGKPLTAEESAAILKESQTELMAETEKREKKREEITKVFEEKDSKDIASIAKEIMPDLRYEGKGEEGHSFTPLSGPSKGGTFTVQEPTKESIAQALKSSQQAFIDGKAKREEFDKKETEEVVNKKSVAYGEEVNVKPTEAQKEAENYKTAKINIDGINLSIENPVGSTRSGKDADGEEWSQKMFADYGRILGSVGYDKDHVDMFVKPNYKGGSEFVYVVNQHNKDGGFDEHKTVIGVGSEQEALDLYNSNYEKGWTGGKSVAKIGINEFKEWVLGAGPKKGALTRNTTFTPGEKDEIKEKAQQVKAEVAAKAVAEVKAFAKPEKKVAVTSRKPDLKAVKEPIKPKVTPQVPKKAPKEDISKKPKVKTKFTEPPKKSVSKLPPENQADIKQELSAELGRGGVARLLKDKVNIVSRDRAKQILGDDYTEGTEALYHNGVVSLVAGEISKGTALNTLSHEYVHANRLDFKQTGAFERLLKTIEKRSKLPTTEGKAIREAMDRVPKDTKPEHVQEEVLSYLVSNSPKIGIARRYLAQIKKFLVDHFGFSEATLKNIDIQAIALSVVRREATGKQPLQVGINEFAEAAKMSVKAAGRKIANLNAFKSWFGDSKVVDENGEPLVVYHGTTKKFTEFKRDFSAQGVFWFSSSIDEIKSGEAGALSSRDIIPVYLSAKKLAGWDEYDKYYLQQLQDMGYDGVKLDNNYIIFKPNQIKSIHNTTWNPADLDIMRSVRKETIKTKSGQYTTTTYEGVDKYLPIDETRQVLTGAKNKALELTDRYMPKERRDAIYTYLADQDLAIAQVQKQIKKQPDETDYELIRSLTGKRIADETKLFDRDQKQPLIEKMAKNKVEFADVHDLSWAQHAPERNLQMKRVNARQHIDSLLQQYTGTQRAEIDDMLHGIQTEFVMNTQTRNQRRDNFVSLIDLMSKDSKQNMKDVQQAQKDLNKRKFTEKEREKGTPEFLQDRMDSLIRKAERRVEISDKWEDVKDRLSGMTNKEASNKIAELKKRDNFKSIQDVVNNLRVINEAALEMNYKAGELTEDEYNAIKNTYKKHVPLYREDMDDSKAPTGRSGLGPLASPVKIAAGSTKGVENIFGHVIDRYQSAVRRKHNLEAGKVLYDMIKANPDESRWSIVELEKKPYHDKEGNIRYYPDQQLGENEVYVKIDGVKKIIHVPKDNKQMMRFMEALKREPVELGPILQASQKITRMLAQLNTSFSPEFIPTNFLRDIQTAGVHIEDTAAKGLQKKIFKNLKKAIHGIYKEERGLDSGEWGNLYRSFSKHGSKIGWMQGYDNVERLAKELESDLSYAKGERPNRQKYKDFVKFVEAMNVSVENGVRLATYKELISPEVGLSERRAAQVVANLTVDFTKRGTAGPAMNSLYMFANAGIQGNVRMIKALSTNKKVQKIAAGIFAAGFAASYVGSLMGGEDKDGDSYYDKLKKSQPSLFERNMIFMIPESGGKYIKIPMPYGYNTIFVAGNEVASAIRGGSPVDGMASIMATFMNTFNPLGSATLLQTIAPTVADPIAQWAENKSWHGGALMPQENQFGMPKPDSERYFNSVNPALKVATSWINRLTGGSDIKEGAISVSPETLEMIVETYTGSLGRFAKDMFSLPLAAVTGELKVRKTPGLRKVFGTKSEHQDRTIYFKNRDDIKEFTAEWKSSTPKERRNLRSDKRVKIMALDKLIDRQLKKLRKRLRRATGIRKENIQKRMNSLYTRYNLAYNKL